MNEGEVSKGSNEVQDPILLPIEEKLYRVKYEVDRDHCHIRLNEAICRLCRDRACLYLCPAKVYVKDPKDDRKIVVNYENCLECGTCRVICEEEGVIWSCPNGGMGVRYRFG
jgi:ferredoxin like protein